MELDAVKQMYFLGIGGIGMSALARFFNEKGVKVHGYDKTETTLTRKLVNEGMTIHYDEDISKIPKNTNLVVWTPAIPKSHRAWQFIADRKILVKKRAEVLGMISRSRKTVGIAGTHGKTTTSSLLTHLLHTGGVKCTAFLGGIAKNWKSNYVQGSSDWVVVEADEYDRSFLQLSPDIAVLLSMDPDHLDIYGDAGRVQETGFKEYLKRVKKGGIILIQDGLRQYFDQSGFETFGVGQGNYRAENVRVASDGYFEFDFIAETKGIHWPGIRLAMPGRHNVENACAAIAVGLSLSISESSVREALADFKGIHRRFEWVLRMDRTVFIDDYAHHPTEIRAAVQAVRELYPGRKITGIFQPHLYSRTKDFQQGFAEELDKLDEIILMDIYPAREEPISGITSAIIFEKMKNPNKILTTKSELMKVVEKQEFEVLLTIGAGDIDTFVEPIKELLLNRNNAMRNG